MPRLISYKDGCEIELAIGPESTKYGYSIDVPRGMTQDFYLEYVDALLNTEANGWDEVQTTVKETSWDGGRAEIVIKTPMGADCDFVNEFRYIVVYDGKENKCYNVMPPEPVSLIDVKALKQLQELSSANRDHQASSLIQLKAALNSFVQSVPQNTLAEKKKLGQWITAELAQYGLAVECPNTPGLAVEVKGDSGNRPGIGRFQFLPLEGGDGRKQRVYRDVLPELNFVQLVNRVDLTPSARPSTGKIER